jgi:HB1, ASXL, restriction endonuclease HTH domain
VDPKPIRDTILETFEECLDAQLRAVRGLRRAGPQSARVALEGKGPKESRSQVDMAYDILREAAQPMHVSEILSRIKTRFGRQVDRESLVSALTKRVARADRFVRTGKNTFALLKVA